MFNQFEIVCLHFHDYFVFAEVVWVKTDEQQLDEEWFELASPDDLLQEAWLFLNNFLILTQLHQKHVSCYGKYH